VGATKFSHTQICIAKQSDAAG